MHIKKQKKKKKNAKNMWKYHTMFNYQVLWEKEFSTDDRNEQL